MPLNNVILTAIALGLTISASFGAPGPSPGPILTPSPSPAPAATPLPTPKPPLYTSVEIAPGKNFEARRMNVFGVIVGAIEFNDFATQHAAMYKDGKLTDLSNLLPPAIESIAQDINLLGEITISTEEKTGFNCYTLFNGHLTHLKPPAGTQLESLGGLNDFGQSVGLGVPNGTSKGFGFFAANGVAVKLPVVIESSIGYGNGINDFAQIIGSISNGGSTLGYLRQPNGELIPLPNIVLPFSINELGHVVGQDGPAANAYLYANGKSTNLGHLSGLGEFIPTGVNNFDVVVGTAFSSTEQTGFVYTNGQMYDLSKSVPGQTFEFAEGPGEIPVVNMFVLQVLDDGRILMIGDFAQRSFVLTPIPNKPSIRP